MSPTENSQNSIENNGNFILWNKKKQITCIMQLAQWSLLCLKQHLSLTMQPEVEVWWPHG